MLTMDEPTARRREQVTALYLNRTTRAGTEDHELLYGAPVGLADGFWRRAVKNHNVERYRTLFKDGSAAETILHGHWRIAFRHHCIRQVPENELVNRLVNVSDVVERLIREFARAYRLTVTENAANSAVTIVGSASSRTMNGTYVRFRGRCVRSVRGGVHTRYRGVSKRSVTNLLRRTR